jgi:hypothetical protein
MSHKTPSGRRRAGRNAFDPNFEPEELNPYHNTTQWGADIYSRDWLDGWNEAKGAYIESEKERENELTLGDRIERIEERLDRLERKTHYAR